MNRHLLRCRSVRFALLGFVLLPAGCIDSEAPLSDPDQSAPDAKLLGRWIHEERGLNPTEITIEKIVAAGYPPGLMKLTLRAVAKGDDQTPKVGYVFRTELKGKTYLNLCGQFGNSTVELPAWNKLRARGFRIFKYAAKKDTLTMWLVDDEAPLKAAVMNGVLKGTIRPQGYLDFEPTVKLKDTTANVAQFVMREDARLFSERKKGVLTRAK